MLKEYLESIRDLTPEKNELTHRPSLYNLLKNLKDNFNKEFKIEHEPERKQGSQPDFRVSYQGLNIGYIENKRVGTDLRKIVESEKKDQIRKYLELNPNLMLTDYLNFMWVGKDENNAPLIKKEISVASLDELSKPLKPNPQTERDLIELFKSFFNHEAAPIANAKDFATHLSAPTKYLKDALITYQKDTQVSSIFNNFKEYLYEELSFEDFSDAFAQTLTYSLFIAKLNHPFEKINLDNVRSSIPKNFAVIREMADFLKKEVLGYIYALLYSPNYRKRYEEFLKADYPKILFTNNKDLFRALSLLGIELIGLHVLNKESLNHSFKKLKDTTIGESCYKEEHDRNPIIKKPSHNELEQRLYINHSAYFRGVSQEIYDYRIGGYGVLDKYLKSHKNEPCNFDHVTNIIKIIACTIEIQKTLGILTSDLPHLKGNDSQALIQEILQNPPPPI
ncbi:hypothetical protein E5K76_06555 [Helicobacter pylori]|nr:hypothetical protein E5K76_06555 [Helicobacter pylori]